MAAKAMSSKPQMPAVARGTILSAGGAGGDGAASDSVRSPTRSRIRAIGVASARHDGFQEPFSVINTMRIAANPRVAVIYYEQADP
jgi:hypothetical protein